MTTVPTRVITPPQVVLQYPKYIQEAYVREFCRVEEETHSVMAARAQADQLLSQLVGRLKAEFRSKMGVAIIAHICEMDPLTVIPANILAEVKKIDPHPFFALYDAGGEGVSTGTLDGRRERKIWSFAAIKELTRKLKDGAGVIIGHNALNQDVRKKYGRIVHAFTHTIRNGLHAIAVVHLTDPEGINRVKSGELDICSIEGDVTLARQRPGSNWFIKSIERIQNLALGSSSETSPGFVGAGILATIQELSKES